MGRSSVLRFSSRKTKISDYKAGTTNEEMSRIRRWRARHTLPMVLLFDPEQPGVFERTAKEVG
jgi:hypothetical protein